MTVISEGVYGLPLIAAVYQCENTSHVRRLFFIFHHEQVSFTSYPPLFASSFRIIVW